MEKVSYALGMSIANNLMASGVKNINVEEFVKAVKASMAGEEPAMSVMEAQQVLNDFFTKLQEEQTAAVRKEGSHYLQRLLRLCYRLQQKEPKGRFCLPEEQHTGNA